MVFYFLKVLWRLEKQIEANIEAPRAVQNYLEKLENFWKTGESNKTCENPKWDGFKAGIG